MKRKIAAFLIGAAAACVCALGFTACDLFGTGNNDGEHEHTVRKYEAKAASCKEEGHIEYWYCNSCGEFYSDENLENKIMYSDTVLEKLPHTEVTDAAVAKTCTKDGKTEGKHCSVCDTVIVAQQVIPASHTEITLPAVPKTCTTDGKTEGKQCSICTQITVPQEMVPAGHTEVIDPAVPKTCTTDGKTEGKHCSVCSQVTLVQTTVPAGHTEVIDPRVEPGCTTAGKTEGKHCSECNTVLVRQNPIQSTGHFEVFDEGTPATCLTSGITVGKHCTQCNQVTQAQTVIPATGHTAVTDPAVAATCTTAGKTQGSHCSVCNTVIVAQQSTPLTGHSGSGSICDNCGALLVNASQGLTFGELTEMPYWYTSRSRVRAASNVTVIGFEVTGRGTCTDANIVIPSTYNGLPVLGIKEMAFSGDTVIRTLSVPNGVKYIGYSAFGACSNLREVNIADSVEKIENSVFRETAITTFKCPAKLQEITSKLFVGCTRLTSIIINANLTKLDDAAFGDNPALTDIYFEGTQAQWEAASRRWTGTEWVGGWDGVYDDIDSNGWPIECRVNINIYSATAPQASGNFWHYDTNGNPVKW